ncbi:MAG: dephospho-CoA kinase [Betaproteobacteria bacterium RBG_16_56_24]|nr:MAG: dephospho-CoA kinase [Betaproteobacteria bacterium RBG_16_56_24]
MSLIVGLTGGIGSGKSTVASLFLEHGAGIIDTDEIAHRLTQADGAAMAAIRADFGDDFITDDGALNREMMRRLIFSDTAAKKRLEAILHPMILDLARTKIHELQASPYIILVAPLLPESPALQEMIQRVLVVDCDENTQIARVTGRSRMTEAEVRAVIAQQTQRAKRLQFADDVIHNESSLGNIAKQVAILHEGYSAII